MNNIIQNTIKIACKNAINAGLKICRGPWFIYENNKLVACDPIFAVIFNDRLNEFNISSLNLEEPGFMVLAREALGVDDFWLYRFWMGFDTNYQILISYEDKDSKKNKTKKDDVSLFGIQLSREF
jgi:hypothetical protein